MVTSSFCKRGAFRDRIISNLIWSQSNNGIKQNQKEKEETRQTNKRTKEDNQAGF
jgi:hypothetical protein